MSSEQKPIQVVVSGTGKMGRLVMDAIQQDARFELVGVLNRNADSRTITFLEQETPLASEQEALKDWNADVVIDFSHEDYTSRLVELASMCGARIVIGTTIPRYMAEEAKSWLDKDGLGGIIAPNFSLGAAVMTKLAILAAPFFQYAEIIEWRHENKARKPSGAASNTARAMKEAKKKTGEYFKSDTESGVVIHSMRSPGIVARHNIVLGSEDGEVLEIRHETTNRAVFVDGALWATKKVMEMNEVVIGLENIVKFDEDL